MASISLKDIQDEAKSITKSFDPVKHTEILSELLKQVEKIDFRKLAKLKSETDTPKRKHYLVISIENILKLSKKNNWGLCKNENFIYIYNGAYWKCVDENDLKSFLAKAAEKMGVERNEARYYVFMDELFKQFLASAHLTKPEPNNGTILINLKNGTFEINTDKQRLRSPLRTDFLKYQLPFEYDKSAKAPLFQSYLQRVQPDKQIQMILAEYIGYLFISPKLLKLEKVLLLYGTGANGKSVFFEIISALLGIDNVSNYSLKSLSDDKGYTRANLANKLLNYASEINTKLETSYFKQLISGEPIEAQKKYGDPFTLTNYAKFIFNCNDLPKDVEHTDAFFRRFLIIPFPVKIPESEQDKELANKITDTELSGVFNWVLEGLNRLLKQKNFTQSETVNQQLKQYRMQADTIHLFTEENNYTNASIETATLSTLFNEYKTYCEEGKYHCCSLRTFGDRLRNIGYKTERKNFGQVVYIKKKVSNDTTLPTQTTLNGVDSAVSVAN